MKKFLSLMGIIAIFVGGFYALNSYIYGAKQGESTSLPDAQYLGFIHAFIDNNTAMDFDDAIWLTGTAAQNAAIRAGHCTEETREDCTPNDFFIENLVKKDVRVSVSSDATVTMQTWKMEETGQVAERDISLSAFAELINNPALHWRQLPYSITVVNNTVIQIKEVYIP